MASMPVRGLFQLGLDPDDPINAFYTTNVELSQSEMCEVMRHILKLA